MSADLSRQLDLIRTAIDRARTADRRMRLAQSLADDIGMQMASQAIRYACVVIGTALASLPPEIVDDAVRAAQQAVAGVTQVDEDPYRPVDSQALHRLVHEDLAALEHWVSAPGRSG